MLLGVPVHREEAEQGEEAVGVVEGIEEAERLLPVGLIDGGVDVDHDTAGLGVSLSQALDGALLEGPQGANDLAGPDSVLEARERGLRRQGLARLRIPVAEHLEHGSWRRMVASFPSAYPAAMA